MAVDERARRTKEREVAADDPSTLSSRSGGGWRLRLPFTWRLLAVAAAAGIVAGILAALGTAAQRPVYESSATLLIDEPLAVAAAADEGQLAKLARLKFKYADLLPTSPLATPIAQQLGISEGAVVSSLFAGGKADSLLLTVVGRWSNPGGAQRLAQAAAGEIVTFSSDEQANSGIPPADRFKFTIVTDASGGAKAKPTRSRIASVGAVAGVLVALLVAVAAPQLRSGPMSRG